MPPAPRLRTRIILLLALPLTAVVLYGTLVVDSVERVSANGERYERPETINELLTDTQIPSQSLLPVYTASLGLQLAPRGEARARQLTELHAAEAAYNERHAYWDAQLRDADLRRALLVDAHEPATAFFRILHEHFLPAVERDSKTLSEALLLGTMLEAYDRNRQAGERVLATAKLQADSVERATAAEEANRGRLLIGLLTILGVWALAAGLAALHTISRPFRTVAADLARDAREASADDDRPSPPASPSLPPPGEGIGDPATGEVPAVVSLTAV